MRLKHSTTGHGSMGSADVIGTPAVVELPVVKGRYGAFQCG